MIDLGARFRAPRPLGSAAAARGRDDSGHERSAVQFGGDRERSRIRHHHTAARFAFSRTITRSTIGDQRSTIAQTFCFSLTLQSLLDSRFLLLLVVQRSFAFPSRQSLSVHVGTLWRHLFASPSRGLSVLSLPVSVQVLSAWFESPSTSAWSLLPPSSSESPTRLPRKS